jgi:hypothetical protein
VLPPPRSLRAALSALTSLRMVFGESVDVSGLTGLRRLWLRAECGCDYVGAVAVEGLSTLTALKDLRLECERYGPLAQPDDLAPLSRLTQLAMTCVPPELPSLPLAARLRRLELQSFYRVEDAYQYAAGAVVLRAPGGVGGSGANGAAPAPLAATLAALARGAPLLERLRIRVTEDLWDDLEKLTDHPHVVEWGAPLGPTVEWPSLTHLEVTPWAAILLAGCTFPRLSRLVANVTEAGGNRSFGPDERLHTAVNALFAKARDHARLLFEPVPYAPHAASTFADVASVPGLRHLTWRGPAFFAEARARNWASLAPTLESLELEGPSLKEIGYAEPLVVLTVLTRLFLGAECIYAPETSPRAPGDARPHCDPPDGPARAARALARLPRLAHLRVAFRGERLGLWDPAWGCPEVAAALARCPALRLLEIDRPGDPLWRHELGPYLGDRPRLPRPSPAWPPFVAALRAGGCGAVVRPGPAEKLALEADFDVDV